MLHRLLVAQPSGKRTRLPDQATPRHRDTGVPTTTEESNATLPWVLIHVYLVRQRSHSATPNSLGNYHDSSAYN